MNEKFESQKEQLVSIKHEISLLYQQINYLIRNEKPLELLDLDVLMNRTHSLYSQLCAINLGEGVDEEDLPFDAEAFSGLFGGMTTEETLEEEEMPAEEERPTEEEIPVESEPEPEPEPEFVPQPEPMPEPEPEIIPEPEILEPEPLPEPQPEPIKEQPVVEAQPIEMFSPVVNEPEPVEEQKEEKPLGDEFGFFFRFEDIPEKEEQPEEDHPIVEADGKVVHVMEEIPEEDIPERDRVHGDDLVMDNPLVMPQMDEERRAEREEIGRQSSEGMASVFEQDDTDFEL